MLVAGVTAATKRPFRNCLRPSSIIFCVLMEFYFLLASVVYITELFKHSTLSYQSSALVGMMWNGMEWDADWTYYQRERNAKSLHCLVREKKSVCCQTNKTFRQSVWHLSSREVKSAMKWDLVRTVLIDDSGDDGFLEFRPGFGHLLIRSALERLGARTCRDREPKANRDQAEWNDRGSDCDNGGFGKAPICSRFLEQKRRVRVCDKQKHYGVFRTSQSIAGDVL